MYSFGTGPSYPDFWQYLQELLEMPRPKDECEILCDSLQHHGNRTCERLVSNSSVTVIAPPLFFLEQDGGGSSFLVDLENTKRVFQTATHDVEYTLASVLVNTGFHMSATSRTTARGTNTMTFSMHSAAIH